MKKQGVAWNKDKTRSVVLSKLKEFTVTENPAGMPELVNVQHKWTVRGWFNQENSFHFGDFKSKDEAVEFLETIHAMF